MVDTTLGSVTLQNNTTKFIIENSVRKEAILSPLPLFGNDSDGTDVYDFGGVIKTINLTGIFIQTTEAAVVTDINEVEALIQGDQSIENGYPLRFVDDRRGIGVNALFVKVVDFESSYVEGFPTGATWSLKLIESSFNG